MLCQACQKKTATTHIKQIVNGELTERHLCPECAAKMGYGNLFGGLGLNLGDLIGSFLGEPQSQSSGVQPLTPETRCKCCGSTFSDIARTGKVGCAECYQTFRERLMPSIQRIHGNTRHVGKVPATASAKAQLTARLEKAREDLAKAIEAQEFEKAAQLRDAIRELESQVKEHG